eukprot:TRINITY_DN12002_c0_g1_i1.p1 TRINITY_DN12002_c0_g1~~TRINITY_DN12002_c0_g1_i1.p1  ORF type:complete len:222 (+),score=35.79 TRINITY_DN12002_c0_g1_i1:94-759(+)
MGSGFKVFRKSSMEELEEKLSGLSSSAKVEEGRREPEVFDTRQAFASPRAVRQSSTDHVSTSLFKISEPTTTLPKKSEKKSVQTQSPSIPTLCLGSPQHSTAESNQKDMRRATTPDLRNMRSDSGMSVQSKGATLQKDSTTKGITSYEDFTQLLMMMLIPPHVNPLGRGSNPSMPQTYNLDSKGRIIKTIPNQIIIGPKAGGSSSVLQGSPSNIRAPPNAL